MVKQDDIHLLRKALEAATDCWSALYDLQDLCADHGRLEDEVDLANQIEDLLKQKIFEAEQAAMEH